MSSYIVKVLPHFFAILAFFTSIAAADSHAAVSPTSLTETELAKRLHFYRSISKLKVDFKQVKSLNDLNVKLSSEGRLELIRPDQVIWEIVKPGRVLISFNQKQIRIESGEGEDASIQILKMEDMPQGKESKSLAGLVAWLQLDAHALSQQYSVLSLGPEKLKFNPKQSENSPFQSIEITLSPSGHLEFLHIWETSGDEIEIQFSKPVIESKGSSSATKK